MRSNFCSILHVFWIYCRINSFVFATDGEQFGFMDFYVCGHGLHQRHNSHITHTPVTSVKSSALLRNFPGGGRGRARGWCH